MIQSESMEVQIKGNHLRVTLYEPEPGEAYFRSGEKLFVPKDHFWGLKEVFKNEATES